MKNLLRSVGLAVSVRVCTGASRVVSAHSALLARGAPSPTSGRARGAGRAPDGRGFCCMLAVLSSQSLTAVSAGLSLS